MDRKLFEAVENGRVEEVREMLATGSSVGARDSASGRTALHYASDLETVKCLLVAGALVNARTRAGRTPLHTAVLRRSVSTVERLIKASAHVNATDMHGNTPLHLAAQLGCDAVKTLLERCKHRNAVNVFGETPLKVARRCNQKCASKMLSVSDSAKLPESAENREKLVCDLKSLLNVPDATLITLVAGKTRLAVHRSVLTARSPVFAAMLAHDTVEASSGQIIIPDIEPNVLHQLVEYMYREYVPEFCTEAQELLVAADKYCMPDLKARCELQLIQDLSVENVTVNCLLAVRHSCLQLKKAAGCFLQANLTRVMDTVGWAEAVTDNPEEFLEVCCLLASLPAETRTPSQKALDGKLLRAIRASTDCVARLISLGACVGARGTGGRTALHIAASCKANGNQSGGTHLPDHPGCCNDCKVKLKTLLEAGADVGARDVNGRTALHLAAASGCEDVTECLLQAGASANVTDRWLQMPLHASLQNGSVGAALDMLRAPVDVNVGDLYGNTPLHVAAQLGNETVFSALLKAGADKNARNSLGETPLDLAERYNMNHLVEVIKVNLTS